MGKIVRISGPVVVAEGIKNKKMFDVVRVGELELVGEIIRIDGDKAVIQVYEDTSGIRPGEKVESTGMPLSVELGPGLLKSIYDGIQRPLDVIKDKTGDFIRRGYTANPIDPNKKWEFKPTAKKGDEVSGNSIIGTVQETSIIQHKIMVPFGINGKITSIEEGKFSVNDVICHVETSSGISEIRMKQTWPVRSIRGVREKMSPNIPLITGQRVIDALFPVAKGGTVAVPGPFGSGKTVVQHQLSKWADSDIVVYVGCGERGNEMTEILTTFPELEDPKTKKPLMERTILIANTSNMPVAAREASIYTGISIAEYYRDMGYGIALMADSTSRWAEALREISGRLEEMPGEEGYPAYLGRRLSEFYERSGNSKIIGTPEREGSITIVGAVSPPGGDISEPVSQNTLRVTRVFWALDSSLASRRHFPSINWLNSYSLYSNDLMDWFAKNVDPQWPQLQQEFMNLLQKEAELQELVQLVGYDALQDREKSILDVSRIIREDFLQQSAFDEIDQYCSTKKQLMMMKLIMEYHNEVKKSLEAGLTMDEMQQMESKSRISRFKEVPEVDVENYFNQSLGMIRDEMKRLRGE
ncbi:V-type ATP synthase subunit A [Caldiplasma sukawensis]